jgi:hypothetical protein
MKTKLIILSFIAIVFIAFTTDDVVSELNGTYRQNRFKYGDMKDWGLADQKTTLKVFRDGYWLAFAYDDKRPNGKPFSGSGGGTYQLKNGKYVETLSYYSWDSTAVGKVYTFDYQLDKQGYKQYGVMNSDKYKDYPINEEFDRVVSEKPLKNDALEGVWFMEEGTWGGTERFGEGNYKGTKVVMIFNYPMMFFAYYKPETKQFQGVGATFYQFDGKNMAETIDCFSWDMKLKGITNNFKITLKDDKFIKEGIEYKGLREIFVKAPKL